MRPSSKVILPYEPGYTGHWEMKKRHKETKESLQPVPINLMDAIKAWRFGVASAQIMWPPARCSVFVKCDSVTGPCEVVS
jgi:hypothetical protein